MEVETKNKSNKKLNFVIGILLVLTVIVGISYSLFKYTRTTDNQQLVAGDIYMKYTGGKEIVLNNLSPRDTYDEKNYFEFTIEGKNDYSKDIWYDIVLSYGADVSDRTERMKDNLLRFRLVEIKDGKEQVVIDNKSYEELVNQIIWVNTIGAKTDNIEITYRLYMWVTSDYIITGNTDDAIYDMDTWNNDVFASINVTVNGDLKERKLLKPITGLGKELLEYDIEEKKDVCNPIVYDDDNKPPTPDDPSDDTIYFSGDNECIDFNYVWYSGKLWRITAIYPDGTMKMITQDAITAINWNENNEKYENSWIYQWLNEDFKETLYNYENIVQNASWNATPDGNDTPKKPPTPLDESADIVGGDVGLLNAYEYYQSYKNASSSTGYLNIGYYWWLITPYSDSNVRFVYSTSYLDTTSPSSNANGVRPSINLKSNIELRGEGTKSNPYTITIDKATGKSGELINTRLSGEYVSVDNKVYRIVGIEEGTTKLTSVDYVRDDSTVLTKNFGSNTSWATSVSSGDENNWGVYLNNTKGETYDGTWITKTMSQFITEGTYYLGAVSSTSYKNSICSESNTSDPTSNCEKTSSRWQGLVGLPRVGEMFSAQLGSGSSSSSTIWLITPYSDSIVRYVNYVGNLGPFPSSLDAYGVRPSIYLKSEVKIISGDGMSESTAYEIGL